MNTGSTAKKIAAFLLCVFCCANVTSAQSVARQWNEALLNAIRIDVPAPTVHARNLYHTSAAMYDAWVTFDSTSAGVFYTDKHSATDLPAARDEAISYAAYRVLSSRYQLANDPVASQALFDSVMSDLGYDPSITTTTGNTPAAIGNRIAETILTASFSDGSNEAGSYEDPTGYLAVNEPMIVDYPDVLPFNSSPLDDPSRWQPLFVDSAITQNGIDGEDLQIYIGPHWGAVTTFALSSISGPESWSDIDPGPAPILNGVGDQEYRDDTMLVIDFGYALDPDEGPGAGMINISPNTNGNRPLGTHDDQGYPVNPVTGQPYADNIVKVADYGRILAEFWADGPESETPPGHWNVIANELSDDPLLVKKIGGVGPTLDDLQWDVKMYLALNGATHDAAVAAWGVKRAYDYVRPITKIRYQGSLGQSSDPNGTSYHPDGLPLATDRVEVITAQSIATGGRHRNVYVNANQDRDGNFLLNFTESQLFGKIAIRVWNHEPLDPHTQVSGIDWILAQNWVPYQRDNFVTPAFAAYVSGHSTFSRAAAEVLTLMTGSPFFPGGLGQQTFTTDFLEFEFGPSQPVTLQWATYYDAADEAGISRLWGGIHVPADDFAGRIMGSSIGIDAFNLAMEFFSPGTTYVPDTFMIFRGLPISGGLADVQNSDDSYLIVRPGFTLNNVDLPVWLIFDSAVAGTPTQLSLSIESSAGTPGLTKYLELFNWNISQYELLEMEPESFNVDVVLSVDLTSAISDAVETGTGNVRTRAGWRQTGFTINFPWLVSVDLVQWATR